VAILDSGDDFKPHTKMMAETIHTAFWNSMPNGKKERELKMAPKLINLNPIVTIKPPPAAPSRNDAGGRNGLRTDLPGDHGPIKPSDPKNVLGNPTAPLAPLQDPNVKPVPSAPYRPVVNPPEPGPAAPAAPLVP
jgi:hypothetical protein